MLVGCAGGSGEVGPDATPGPDGGNGPDAVPARADAAAVDASRSDAPSTAVCGGSCELAVENDCTCGAADPCGWAQDGSCQQTCALTEWGFGDDLDCDLDYDGMTEPEEHQLAYQFRPALLLASSEKNSERMPHFAVSLAEDRASASIFYALAYHVDSGDPETGLFEHLGDSEFVVVDVVAVGGNWYPTRVFLSSHYLASTDASQWYEPRELEWDESDGGAHPIVWVAVDKHGNYPDPDTCDNGGFYTDWCEYYEQPYPIELLEFSADRNIGSLDYPLLDAVVVQNGAGERTEYFWTDLPFCGWQVESLRPEDRDGCAPPENSYARQLLAWLQGL